MVKINNISYTTQPQPTTVVTPSQDLLDFHRRTMTFFRHGYDRSNDKSESIKKEHSSKTIHHGSGKIY